MPAIPFKIISTILRQPANMDLYPERCKGIDFFQSETAVIQKLFTYILTEKTVSEALYRSLIRVLHSHRRNHFSNLPFDEQDLLTDIFIRKLSSANRNKGLACPSDWYTRTPEIWYNWLKVSLQNQLRDILRSPKHSPHKSLNDPIYNDSNTSLLSLVVDENANRDQLEIAETESRVATFNDLQSTFAIHMPRLPDLRRLCWLLLKAPDFVSEKHFFNARTQYSRSNEDAHSIWTATFENYKNTRDVDDQQFTKSRAFLTWLLFGQDFANAEDFQRKGSKVFNACRDNLRQNVTRATSNIHYQLLPYWIWLSHSNEYQTLWGAFLRQSLNLAAIQKQNNLGLQPSFDEEKIFRLLFQLQTDINGLSVKRAHFLEFCSIILPDYCSLRDRREQTSLFVKKSKRITTRFIDCHNQLPNDLQIQLDLEELEGLF